MNATGLVSAAPRGNAVVTPNFTLTERVNQLAQQSEEALGLIQTVHGRVVHREPSPPAPTAPREMDHAVFAAEAAARNLNLIREVVNEILSAL